MQYDDRIEVMRGREKRSAEVLSDDQGFYFISPFTGLRCLLPPRTDPPSSQIKWFTNEHRRISKRLETSRRCPDRLRSARRA